MISLLVRFDRVDHHNPRYITYREAKLLKKPTHNFDFSTTAKMQFTFVALLMLSLAALNIAAPAAAPDAKADAGEVCASML